MSCGGGQEERESSQCVHLEGQNLVEPFRALVGGGGGMSQVDIVRDRKGLGGPSNKLKA